MFLGQLACEAVNFVLKRLIKEERPRLLVGDAVLAKGYGMPSSHAQFTAFWAVALSLFLLVRHRPPPPPLQAHRRADGAGKAGGRSGSPSLADVSRAYWSGGLAAASASIEAYSHAPWTLAQRGALSAGALLVAALVACSRVYLGYHTARQVLAGFAAGAVSAAAWFAVTHVLRQTGLLAWALELPLARWFRVRDLVIAEDLCQAGWEKWELGRRAALERQREGEKRREGKRE